jgi:anti-sigma B factor antagonist
MSAPATVAGAVALRIDTEMTIAAAAGLRETLVDAVAAIDADGAPLRLDLSAVHDFDSSGVQLLLATRRSLAAQGSALHLVAPTTAVRDALLLFGLQSLLVDPAEPARSACPA